MMRMVIAAALTAAGCTDLSGIDCLSWDDDYGGGYDPGDLYFDEDARSGELHRSGDALLFDSDYPRAAAPGCDCDADADGLDDRWEDSALANLKPALQLHPDEPALCDRGADIAMVGRVTPVGDRVRVLIAIVYTADYGRCGLVAHRGDVERVALDLEPLALANTVRVSRVYTAAHEYTSLDGSEVHDAAVLLEAFEGDERWIAFVSSGKHATYVSEQACRGHTDLPCARESCPDEHYLTQAHPPITNAGEPSTAKADQLVSVGAGEVAIWSDEIYCPDVALDAPCGSSSVAEKLRRDPFVDGQPMIE